MCSLCTEHIAYLVTACMLALGELPSGAPNVFSWLTLQQFYLEVQPPASGASRCTAGTDEA